MLRCSEYVQPQYWDLSTVLYDVVSCCVVMITILFSSSLSILSTKALHFSRGCWCCCGCVVRGCGGCGGRCGEAAMPLLPPYPRRHTQAAALVQGRRLQAGLQVRQARGGEGSGRPGEMKLGRERGDKKISKHTGKEKNMKRASRRGKRKNW